MTKVTTSELRAILKAQIIANTDSARTLRQKERERGEQIRSLIAEGKDWWDHVDWRTNPWSERMTIRHQARCVFLAYAFLRNRSYKRVEPTTREENHPLTGDSLVGQITNLLETWDQCADYDSLFDQVTEWIEVGTVRRFELAARDFLSGEQAA